jgi:hypothetical protein
VRTITSVLAVLLVVLALPSAAPAQTAPLPGPVVQTCPALFHVLHDDHIGPLTLPQGRYWITTFGGSAPDCHTASDLLRQFLEDWDGRLPRPWVVDPAAQAFVREPSGTTGFGVRSAPSGTPDSGGGGRHPASGAQCPGLFHVLHDDRIGTIEVEAGWYTITVLGLGRLSCARASTLFSEFLQDFTGRLPGRWTLDAAHGTFFQANNRNVAFRVKEAVADASRNAQRGSHPQQGAQRCPGTFRVQNNDRIGRLRLAAGRYRLTAYGSVTCAQAAQQLARFLQLPQGNLPSPWRMDVSEASFWRGRGRTNGFRAKAVTA